MEGTASVASAKSPKLGKKQGTQLENLPDALLLHILSFLPTVDVVRTSALSGRWRTFWKLVSHVDIKELGEDMLYDLQNSEGPPARDSFMNFVESVLLKRVSSNINYFTLSLCVLRDASRVNSWIFAVLTHKVQKLCLKLWQILDEYFELPSCLFTSQFLTHLKIEIISDLRFPPTIFLPVLAELELSCVTFAGDNTAIGLFSGCPNLKKLSLKDCDWSERAICISAPRLEELSITELLPCDSPRAPQVVIFAENLKEFSLTGDLSNDYFLHSPALIYGYIDFFSTDDSRSQKEKAFRVHRLLWQLTSVKRLSISSNTVEVLDWAEDLLAHLPSFQRLDSLYVIESVFSFPSEALLTILRNSPLLALLDFDRGFALSDNFKGTPIINSVPSCFSTHLKIIRIKVYSQTDGELHILDELLGAGSVLEKLHISSLELKDRPDAILRLYRRSPNCQIILS